MAVSLEVVFTGDTSVLSPWEPFSKNLEVRSLMLIALLFVAIIIAYRFFIHSLFTCLSSIDFSISLKTYSTEKIKAILVFLGFLGEGRLFYIL